MMWPFSPSYRFLPLDKIATPPNNSSQTTSIAEYDYVIIGGKSRWVFSSLARFVPKNVFHSGGTSGCVLASRLSEDPNVSVLLLECGGVPSWMSRVPLFAFANLFTETKVDYIYNWFASVTPIDDVDTGPMNTNTNPSADAEATSVTRPFSTIRSPGKIALLAGKVLGGSSECTDLYASIPGTRKAANAMGVPTIRESNLPEGPAVGVFELERTSDPKGYKLSTFDAFLPPRLVRKRKNLTICTKMVATSIDIGSQAGNELQAKGVFLKADQIGVGNNSEKKTYYVAAKREVILCAGVIVSPQILMLSGIGPKQHLEEIGIPILKDLPGVGEHLVINITLYVRQVKQLVTARPRSSLSNLRRTFTRFNFNPTKETFSLHLEFLKFLLFGVGYLLFPIPQSVIYLRSTLLTHEGKLLKEDIPCSELDTRSPENIPDIEININPCITTFSPPPPLTRNDKGYFSFFSFGLQPKSLGHVRLLSKDPFEKADCMLGFYARDEDRRVMRKVIRFCVTLTQKMKEQGYDIEPLLVPKGNDDKDLDDFIRHEPRSNYHYSSTCRMAPEHPRNPSDPNDTPGVVDHELRVHGVHKLRVADASIFPTIPAGHIQAHTVLVAEKCAELLKASWKGASN